MLCSLCYYSIVKLAGSLFSGMSVTCVVCAIGILECQNLQNNYVCLSGSKAAVVPKLGTFMWVRCILYCKNILFTCSCLVTHCVIAHALRTGNGLHAVNH